MAPLRIQYRNGGSPHHLPRGGAGGGSSKSRLRPKVYWKGPWALLESYSGRRGSEGSGDGVTRASADKCSMSVAAAAAALLLLRCCRLCRLGGSCWSCCPSRCSSCRFACLRFDGLGGLAAASAACCFCWRCCWLRRRLLAAAAGAAGAAASAAAPAATRAGRAKGLGSAEEATTRTLPAAAGVDKGGMAGGGARGVSSPLPPAPPKSVLSKGPVVTAAMPGGEPPPMEAGPVLLLRPLRSPRPVARRNGSGGAGFSGCPLGPACCCACWICVPSISRARRMGSKGALPFAAACASSPPGASGCAADRACRSVSRSCEPAASCRLAFTGATCCTAAAAPVGGPVLRPCTAAEGCVAAEAGAHCVGAKARVACSGEARGFCRPGRGGRQ